MPVTNPRPRGARGARIGVGLLSVLAGLLAVTFVVLRFIFPLMNIRTATTAGGDLILTRHDGINAQSELATLPLFGHISDFMQSWWMAFTVAAIFATIVALLAMPRESEMEPQGGTSMRRQGVRGRVFAALIIPLVALIAAGIFICIGAINDLGTARTAVDVVDFAPKVQAVNEAIFTERKVALSATSEDDRAVARQDTDVAIDELETSLPGLDLAGLGGDLNSDAKNSVATALAKLAEARENQIKPDTGLDVVDNSYSAATDELNAMVDRWAARLGNRSVGENLHGVVALDRLIDAINRETPVIVAALNEPEAPVTETPEGNTGGTETGAGNGNGTGAGSGTGNGAGAGSGTGDGTNTPQPVTAPSLIQLRAANFIRATDAQRANASQALQGLAESSKSLALPDSSYTQARALIAIPRPQDVVSELRSGWQARADAEISSVGTARNQLLESAGSLASTERDNANTLAIGTIVATIVTILLSMTVAALIAARVGRRITETPEQPEQPTLEGVLIHPATDQIPAQIAPITPDASMGSTQVAPIGTPAAASVVADVKAPVVLHDSVAEAFANVARRDQVLLARQLSVLDELERLEEDPEVLTQLFFLDNLATRMRRNSDSLMVLAGGTSGRRNRKSMLLSDVIRTASSEIEQYDRIRLDVVEDPIVLGHNVRSGAHLIAELLENATIFSEPNTPVEVKSSVRADSVEVRIIDVGMGMNDADLATANAKVASGREADISEIQQLGLHVVGRLSQSLGAQVLLSHNADRNGTEATVTFPISLFTDALEEEDLPQASAAPSEDYQKLAGSSPRRRTGPATGQLVIAPMPPIPTDAFRPTEMEPDWRPSNADTTGLSLPIREPAAGEATPLPTRRSSTRATESAPPTTGLPSETPATTRGAANVEAPATTGLPREAQATSGMPGEAQATSGLPGETPATTRGAANVEVPALPTVVDALNAPATAPAEPPRTQAPAAGGLPIRPSHGISSGIDLTNEPLPSRTSTWVPEKSLDGLLANALPFRVPSESLPQGEIMLPTLPRRTADRSRGHEPEASLGSPAESEEIDWPSSPKPLSLGVESPSVNTGEGSNRSDAASGEDTRPRSSMFSSFLSTAKLAEQPEEESQAVQASQADTPPPEKAATEKATDRPATEKAVADKPVTGESGIERVGDTPSGEIPVASAPVNSLSDTQRTAAVPMVPEVAALPRRVRSAANESFSPEAASTPPAPEKPASPPVADKPRAAEEPRRFDSLNEAVAAKALEGHVVLSKDPEPGSASEASETVTGTESATVTDLDSTSRLEAARFEEPSMAAIAQEHAAALTADPQQRPKTSDGRDAEVTKAAPTPNALPTNTEPPSTPSTPSTPSSNTSPSSTPSPSATTPSAPPPSALPPIISDSEGNTAARGNVDVADPGTVSTASGPTSLPTPADRGEVAPPARETTPPAKEAAPVSKRVSPPNPTPRSGISAAERSLDAGSSTETAALALGTQLEEDRTPEVADDPATAMAPSRPKKVTSADMPAFPSTSTPASSVKPEESAKAGASAEADKVTREVRRVPVAGREPLDETREIDLASRKPTEAELSEAAAWRHAIRTDIAAQTGERPAIAYRPDSVELDDEDLASRVPQRAVEPIPEVAPGAHPRDAERLRERLAMFQDAANRGRKDAGDAR